MISMEWLSGLVCNESIEAVHSILPNFAFIARNAETNKISSVFLIWDLSYLYTYMRNEDQIKNQISDRLPIKARLQEGTSIDCNNRHPTITDIIERPFSIITPVIWNIKNLHSFICLWGFLTVRRGGAAQMCNLSEEVKILSYRCASRLLNSPIQEMLLPPVRKTGLLPKRRLLYVSLKKITMCGQ